MTIGPGCDEIAGRLAGHLAARPGDAPGSGCPDAEVLAAWADSSLGVAERDTVDHHLATCARCQHVLAVMARMPDAAASAAAVPARSASAWALRWRWLLPAAAVATAAIAWFAVRPTSVPDTGALRPAMELAKSEPAQTPPLSGDAGAASSRSQKSDAAPPVPAPSAPPAGQPVGTDAVGRGVSARPPRAAPTVADAFAARPPALAEPQPAKGGAAPAANVFAAAPPPAAARAEAAAEVEQKAAAQAQLDEQKDRAARLRAVAQRPQESPAPGKAAEAVALVGGVRQPMAAKAFQIAALPLVHSPDRAVAWRLSDAGRIERSVDGGRTWHVQWDAPGNRMAAGSSPSQEVCWVVGALGRVWRTVDGATWARVASPIAIDLVAVAAVSASTATVTAIDGRSFRTTDGGRTWEAIDTSTAAATPSAAAPHVPKPWAGSGQQG